MTDQQHLIELLKATAIGDRKAFEQLYQATSAKLFAVSLQLLRRHDWAEDLLQDVFIKVWHNASDYHTEKGTVMTWMISITRYRALDLLKSRHMKAEFIELDSDWIETLQSGDFAAPDVDKSRIDVCMDSLESEHRQSIYLAYINGLSHQEITQYIDAPLGSIKSWIRRGLVKLKRCLET